MSDIAKWALLGASALLIIGLLVALPFMEGINIQELTSNINNIVSIASDYLVNAKGLINNFLTPVGRTIFCVVLYWIFGKWFLLGTIRITAYAYHYIFRG